MLPMDIFAAFACRRFSRGSDFEWQAGKFPSTRPGRGKRTVWLALAGFETALLCSSYLIVKHFASAQLGRRITPKPRKPDVEPEVADILKRMKYQNEF
jgi:hypothetical protein